MGASLAAGLIVVGGVWRGLDLTDEGFYLNWISNPFLYNSSFSQFGFLLHPAYVLVGRHLILLRLVGVALLGVAATAFVVMFFCLPIHSTLPKRDRLLLAISCSATALFFYRSWIPTPNYNLLSLAGTLIVFVGWLKIIRAEGQTDARRWRRMAPVVICAVGFAILALVKPTAAAVLAIVLAPLTLAFGRRALLDIVVTGVLSCLLFALVLVAIDGGLATAVMRYRTALYQNELLQSGHDWRGFIGSFNLSLGYQDWIALACMAAIGPVVSFALSRTSVKATALLACFAALAIQFVLFWPLHAFPNLNNGVANFSLAILTVSGIATTWLRKRRPTLNPDMDRGYFAVLIALILAPVAFAFGTSSGLWSLAAHAGIFWTTAIVLFITLAAPATERLRWIQFATAASACLVMQTTIAAVKRPYRIPGPLWEQTESIASATEDPMVKVDPVTASYFRNLLAGARRGGFQVGMPMIDMTGTAPSTQYVLGGEPVGLAWIIGGYRGSRALAIHALSQVPIGKLRRAWILTAPAGHRPLPLDVLAAVGLDFPQAYDEVARARTGYADEIHVLWRPHAVTTSPGGPAR